ncbi:MAG: putative phage abortive infection protein [Raineya sp.]|jgi:hypothetical protein|nr:putative phage abortive infection protein [Raineya sp.]
MDDNKKKYSIDEIISYAAITIGFLSIVAGVLIPEKYSSKIGDFSGGVTSSFFSLAGVFLVISTLKLQRKEMESNQKAISLQEKVQAQQAFESAFFNLLTFHHEIVNAITRHERRQKYKGIVDQFINNKASDLNESIFLEFKGRDCFEVFKKALFDKYKSLKKKNGYVYSCKENETIFLNEVYLEFYEDHQSDLGHYFRNLYHLFKFIKLSKIDVSEKQRYASLVRAQLSNDELILIFYNCLSDNGWEKFKPLVEEFHLMKNLNASTLIEENAHLQMYDTKAYFTT